MERHDTRHNSEAEVTVDPINDSNNDDFFEEVGYFLGEEVQV